ncbi:GGDEF domain-containing protein [Aquihabitans sp. G128]|uniref:GGDEF domain-containing protein n=1 Tax=Aquihabitans sp. G128 TaxID=2849779 RepID=UPI001C2383E4|nr:sensor domain-containing diguanylate cyclase [Aquihabitans sp. G128]QXC59740.1 GGDEF domain-containing protein [Aquihabitans sp. G128]
MDLLPIGVAVLAPGGQLQYVNPAARALLGCATGLPHLSELLPLAAQATTFEALASAAETAVSTQLVVELLEGERRELQFSVHPGADRDPLIIVTIQDVTLRHESELELEHRASHDGLTGLRNRAWLLDHLHARLAAAEQLVIAFVDLDRFKAVNDDFGHDVGDGLLRHVADAVESCLHPGEVASRVGGDEFVVVSRDLDDDQLADFDQRLRLAVATLASAREHRVGVSIGTVRSVEGDEPWSLMRRADEAMYRHKRDLERRRRLRRGT